MNILNKNNIKEKSRRWKLIERSIIFSITVIGFSLFLIFDLFFAYAYRIDGFNDLQWIAYWTHLSNLAALIWISLAFLAVTTNNEKLESWIQHWNIKNTVFTFIIVTGLVFMVVAYIPVVIAYTKNGDIAEIQELVLKMAWTPNHPIIDPVANGLPAQLPTEITPELISGVSGAYETTAGYTVYTDPTALYRASVIVGTSFKHLIIPAMFLYLGFTEIGYNRTKGLSDYQRSMIQFIWPCLYIVYAITLCSVHIILPPYPVLDFGFTYTFYSMSESMQITYALTALFLDIVVGVIFVLVSFAQNKWNNFILS